MNRGVWEYGENALGGFLFTLILFIFPLVGIFHVFGMMNDQRLWIMVIPITVGAAIGCILTSVFIYISDYL